MSKFFQVIPVEKVDRIIPESYTFMGMLDNTDEVQLIQKEQYWIKKLNTLTPNGLNIRKELPPPIPFSITFSDQSYDIARFVKTTYHKIQDRKHQLLRRLQMITSHKRNPNLKDLLVTAKLN